MRTITIAATIGILTLALNAKSEELILTHRGNINTDAMNLEATHVSLQKCDQMNYEVGRAIKWDGVGTSYSHHSAGNVTAEPGQNQKANAAPTWVSDLQGRASTYHAERQNRAKKYEIMMSRYSPTELSIAKSMGKQPWEINRNQLKKWARETDNIIP
jgi:hypothetical protein